MHLELTPRQKGAASLVASAFGFALMALFVGMCDRHGNAISCFQKSFFRNLVALFFAAAIFFRQRRHVRNPAAAAAGASGALSRTPRERALAAALLLARSITGVIGIFCNFYALAHIPIGEAMMLNKTAPFFIVALSWAFLGEKANFRQIVSLIVAFCGVALVVKPSGTGGDFTASICGLVGGLAAGAAYTCVRELGKLKVEPSLIVLFFSAFSCLASLPFMIFRPDAMNWTQLLILFGAGAGAAIGQFGVTAAYRYAPAKEIAVFDYSSVVFSALFGLAFLDQVPDVISVAGFILIVAASFVKR